MRFHCNIDENSLPFVPETLKWGPIIKRGRRRGDYQNPPAGTDARRILDDVWEAVWPKFRGRLGSLGLQSTALAYVDPGEKAQPFHCDADGDERYHTVLVPLTTEIDSGGTQFEDGVAFLPRRGIAYCFDGALVHRGAAHRGEKRRVFAAYVLAPGVYRDLNIFN